MKKFLVVILILVLLGGGGFALYWFVFKNKINKPQEQPEEGVVITTVDCKYHNDSSNPSFTGYYFIIQIENQTEETIKINESSFYINSSNLENNNVYHKFENTPFFNYNVLTDTFTKASHFESIAASQKATIAILIDGFYIPNGVTNVQNALYYKNAKVSSFDIVGGEITNIH